VDLGPFGFSELLFIALLALVVFGPRRLPEIGHAAGRAVSKLKRAANELRAAYESELDDDSRRQIQAAKRGLIDVKDTVEAAARDIWQEGDRAAQSVRDVSQELRADARSDRAAPPAPRRRDDDEVS
jgi:Tat protein translocase TatB subunit